MASTRTSPSSAVRPRPAQTARMNQAVRVSLLPVALLLVNGAPSQAGHVHHRPSRAVVVVAPSWWWDPWYPYGWYPPPTYVYPPPSIVGAEPVEYIEQRPAESSPRPEGYWYYCATANAYYPAAPTCPEQWVKVPPRSE